MLPVFIMTVVFVYFLYLELHGKRRNLPPGPRPWPLFGNVLQLDRTHPQRSLADWWKQYGPVITVWLPQPYIIINDYQLLKDTFAKQGDVFAGRPTTFLSNEFMKGNYGLLMATGRRWHENRRFAHQKVFGGGRKTMEQHTREQAALLVSRLRSAAHQPIVLKEHLVFAVANVITYMTFGFTWKWGDAELRQFRDIFAEMSFTSHPFVMLLELFPWLRHLEPPLNIGLKGLNAINDGQLAVLSEQIEKHKMSLVEDLPAKDFTDEYLIELKKRRKNGENEDIFSDHQMLMTISEIYTGGVETPVAALRFALRFLMNDVEVQRRIQEQLDDVIGSDRELRMDDQKSLPYLCATIQEVLRMASVNPVGVPHCTTADTVVAGYKIAKGTIVVAQPQSIHQDAQLYAQPNVFRPERHLNAASQFVKDDRILPFSLGKCVCPGESLSRMQLFIFIGTIMQHFTLRPVNGSQPPLTEVSVGFVRGPLPFECLVIPRDQQH